MQTTEQADGGALVAQPGGEPAAGGDRGGQGVALALDSATVAAPVPADRAPSGAPVTAESVPAVDRVRAARAAGQVPGKRDLERALLALGLLSGRQAKLLLARGYGAIGNDDGAELLDQIEQLARKLRGSFCDLNEPR